MNEERPVADLESGRRLRSARSIGMPKALATPRVAASTPAQR